MRLVVEWPDTSPDKSPPQLCGCPDGGLSFWDLASKQMSGVLTYAVLPDFGFDAGIWRLNCHPRFLGDTTGDSCPDIVGFGENYVLVSSGKGSFVSAQSIINGLCCTADGWRFDQHPISSQN